MLQKHTFLIISLVISQLGFAQLPFISTWKTDNAGTSNATSITIPVDASQGPYSYNVDWDNDGVFDEFGLTGSVTHDFGTAGTYTIRIEGDFPAIQFYNDGDKEKLLDVSQWGDISWKSFNRAFMGCSNLNISATDAPDLSKVTLFTNAFVNCSALNSNINHWDVSNVTEMTGTFQNCVAFNQPMDNWDVSNVTTMRYMFAGATTFNQDIGNWDVRNLLNTSTMFSGATAFNQDIGAWQLDNLKIADFMFSNTANFNQPLGNWRFPNLTSLRGMFTKAKAFNEDISAWDVSNVSNLSYLFDQASSFNQDISSWDVSNATNFEYMFNGAQAFDQNIGNWDMSSAENMGYMFRGATSFNQDIGRWDVSNVTNMSHTFSQARSFNYNIGNWDVANVTQMEGMFSHADVFNQDISGWNTGKVTSMKFMFLKALAFDQPIGSWDVSNVTNMNSTFNGASVFNQDINAWDVSKVTTMNGMFGGAVAFNSPLNNWNTASLTDMTSMFFVAGSFNQDISNWDVSKVTDMFRVFRQAYSFNQDLSGWDVSNVTSMQEMLYGTTEFNQDLSAWDVGKVTNLKSFLFGAKNFDQNLGNWDVSSLLEAEKMLTSVPLSISNYDSLLIGWASQNLQDDVVFTANKAIYCLGKDARESMINDHNWTIDDSGLESTAPTAICKDTTLYIPFSTEAIVLDPMEIGGESYDNCSSVSLSLWQTTFDCDDVDLTTEDTLWVEDENGFKDFCLANITVLDTNTQVIVTCPSDTVISASESNCSQTVSWDAPEVRCNAVSIVSNFNSGDQFDLGDHAVHYTVTDKNGVSETCAFTVSITSDLSIAIDSTTPPSCSDVADGQAFVTVQGGVGAYTFDWNHDGTGDFDDQANELLRAGTFDVEVSDAIGCKASTNATLIANSSTIDFCPSDTIIRANASDCRGSVQWKEPTTLCSEAILTSDVSLGDILPLGTTTVTYTSTDLLGNQDECVFDVTIYDDFEIHTVSTDGPDCDDPQSGKIELETMGGTAPFSYHWNEGTSVLNTTEFLQAETGLNEVIAFDASGCVDTLEVEVPETLPLELSLDTALYLKSVELSPIIENGYGSLQYDWSNGSFLETLSLSPTKSQWLFLTVTDDKNCSDTTSIYLDIEVLFPEKIQLQIPSGFTPNGDGKNDYWFIQGLDYYQLLELVVFNRWGNEVYRTSGEYVPWNGLRNGKPLPVATYYYVLKIKGEDENGESDFRGSMVIMR